MRLLAIPSLLFIAGLAQASSISYSITTVNTNIPLSGVYSLNNFDQIAATGYFGTSGFQAVIGTAAGFAAVPLPDGWNSYTNALALNDSGQVAGIGDNGTGTQAFLGTAAGSSPIPIPAGWTTISAFGVNDSGQVVGSGYTGVGSVYQAFIGTPSSVSIVPLPPGWYSAQGFAINDSGQVTGVGVDGVTIQAFIGTTLGSTPIPLPPGWTGATGQSINNAGQVVGSNLLSNPGAQAFIGTTAGSSAIPLPDGATWAGVSYHSLNDLGSVVGYSDKGGWIWDASDGTRLLTDLVGTTITGAIAINDRGQILGTDSTGYVLLTPNDDPGPPIPGSGSGGTSVPEIDVSSCSGALALLSGALLVIRGRRTASRI